MTEGGERKKKRNGRKNTGRRAAALFLALALFLSLIGLPTIVSAKGEKTPEQEDGGPQFIVEEEAPSDRYSGKKEITYEVRGKEVKLTVPQSILISASTVKGSKTDGYYGENRYPDGTPYTFPGEQTEWDEGHYWIESAVYPETPEETGRTEAAGNYFDGTVMSLKGTDTAGGTFVPGNVWCSEPRKKREDSISIRSANLYLVTDSTHYRVLELEDGPWLFIPYYRVGLEGTASIGEQQHVAVSGYLKFPVDTRKPYFAAIYKENDAGTALSGVTFDLGINEGEKTSYTGLKTGTFYNAVQKRSFSTHPDGTKVEDGILTIYLGKYDVDPVCYIRENWTDSRYEPNASGKVVRVFSGDSLSEADEKATACALEKKADVTWINRRHRKYYAAAICKTDDSDQPMNKVTFDVTLGTGETYQGLATGTRVNTSTGRALGTHIYQADGKAVPIEEGLLVIYLGELEEEPGTIRVRENWNNDRYYPNNEERSVTVYSGDTPEEAERLAVTHALGRNSDVKWVNRRHRKYYAAAVIKTDDEGDPMNGVTFDVGVALGEGTICRGLKTGTRYNVTNGRELTTHIYQNGGKPAPVEDGLLVIYLGEQEEAPESVYVKENWNNPQYYPNTTGKKVQAFCGDTPEEAERLAVEHALDPKKNTDVKWINSPVPGWYLAFMKVDDEGTPVNDITFDIQVGNDPVRTKAVYTGWLYNYAADTEGSLDNRFYSSQKKAYPGMALVYLGESATPPKVVITENDQDHRFEPGEWTHTFTASEIYTGMDEARKHAVEIVCENRRSGKLSLVKKGPAADPGFLQYTGPDGKVHPNLNYSLEGAVYGVYASAENAEEGREILAEFTTDKEGVGHVSHKGSFIDEDTILSGIPQGHYYVREIRAPKGYRLDRTVYPVTIGTKNLSVKLTLTDEPDMDQVLLRIEKCNAADGSSSGNGTYSLAGAQFTVKYWAFDDDQEYSAEDFRRWEAAGYRPERTWVIETKENKETGRAGAELSENFLVSGDALYVLPDSREAALPFGWITIEETRAPEGFDMDGAKWTTPDGDEIRTGNMIAVRTSENRMLVTENRAVLSEGDAVRILERPLRGDVEILKEDQRDRAMAGVLFRITNQETGETHILATDEDGYASTASSYQLHSLNTAYYDEGSEYDGTKAGIWFGKNPTGETVGINDDLGALPPGQYLVEELPCKGNEGKQYIDPETFVITGKENKSLRFRFRNMDEPAFTTELLSVSTGGHDLPGEKDQELTDTVMYTNLKADTTYTLVGKLMVRDRKTGKVTEYRTPAGEIMQVTKTFTTPAEWKDSPYECSGQERITFTGIDATELAGKSLVAYQSLYLGNTVPENEEQEEPGTKTGMERFFPICEEDPECASQTVTVSSGRTRAYYADTTKTALPGKITLVDTIIYDGLIPGKEYRASGTLYLRPKEDPEDKVYTEAELEKMKLSDADGIPVTAEAVFTPEAEEGSAEVVFTVDASGIREGEEIVVFEEVTKDGIRVFTHADIHDRAQTVFFPKIRTTAAGENGQKMILDHDGTFTDTVEYENLEPETGYTLVGTVMDRETGKELLLSGKPVTVKKTFTTGCAEEGKQSVCGKEEVVFSIPAASGKEIEGKNLVIFEVLYNQMGSVVARHEDPDDRGQELFVPKIRTVCRDAETDDHISCPGGKVTLKDTVSYSGLVPETEYLMKGMIVRQDTGEALLDENGEWIMAEAGFTAGAEGKGEVELLFSFRADLIFTGKTGVVAFETCYSLPGLLPVASHADITDRDQTVVFPEIGTAAGYTEEKDGKITVTDILTYDGLIPGRSYMAVGTLVKPDGTQVMAEGKLVSGRTGFVPEKESGTVNVVFQRFDPFYEYTDRDQDMEYTYVVFEEVYLLTDPENDPEGEKSRVLIGEHKDLCDVDQTVTGSKDHDSGEPPKIPEKEPEPPAPKPPVPTTEEPPTTEKPPTPTTEKPPAPSTEEKTPAPPVTGDDTPILPALILMTGAAIGGTLILCRKKRKK